MTSDERAAAGRKGAAGLTVEGVETWAGRVSGDGMGLTACSSFALAVYGARAGGASFLCGGFAVGRWDGGIACGANTEGTEEGGTEVLLMGSLGEGHPRAPNSSTRAKERKRRLPRARSSLPATSVSPCLRFLRVCRCRPIPQEKTVTDRHSGLVPFLSRTSIAGLSEVQPRRLAWEKFRRDVKDSVGGARVSR